MVTTYQSNLSIHPLIKNLLSKPHTHMVTLPGSNVLTNVLMGVKNLCSLNDYLNDNYISIKFKYSSIDK